MSVIIDTTMSEVESVIKYARYGANNCMIGNGWEIKELVRCKDCRWWDEKDGANYGYCHAAKHGYFSKHWEISIYRTYQPDFYCADGERRSE